MARIRIERYHGQSIPSEYSRARVPRADLAGLIPDNVLIVDVASFTFQFVSIEQIQDCLRFYERSIHESSRLEIPGDIDHWEAQRWFERLPMYLLESSKRRKVIKALGRALEMADAGAFSRRV